MFRSGGGRRRRGVVRQPCDSRATSAAQRAPPVPPPPRRGPPAIHAPSQALAFRLDRAPGVRLWEARLQQCVQPRADAGEVCKLGAAEGAGGGLVGVHGLVHAPAARRGTASNRVRSRRQGVLGGGHTAARLALAAAEEVRGGSCIGWQSGY